MAEKMLIDASHSEETRVVVVRGNRIEEFDFESEHKKQIRGNIYLAKVTRVEPSLQAAFVDYGGNRHGFLAFAEIHPDYYQIPLADRQALLKAEAEEARRDDDIEHVETAPAPASELSVPVALEAVTREEERLPHVVHRYRFDFGHYLVKAREVFLPFHYLVELRSYFPPFPPRFLSV